MAHFFLWMGDLFHLHLLGQSLAPPDTCSIEELPEDLPVRFFDEDPPAAPCENDLARFSLTSEVTDPTPRLGMTLFSPPDGHAARRPAHAEWSRDRWM